MKKITTRLLIISLIFIALIMTADTFYKETVYFLLFLCVYLCYLITLIMIKEIILTTLALIYVALIGSLIAIPLISTYNTIYKELICLLLIILIAFYFNKTNK